MIPNTKCRKCVYRMDIGRVVCCGYLLYTGHARIKLNDLPGECSVYLPQKGNAALRRELLRKVKVQGLPPKAAANESVKYLTERFGKDSKRLY